VLRIASPETMRRWSREQRRASRTIALVPTMGYLHEGHLRLIDRARESADVVVVSVFVNPTQFGPGEDFLSYPRDLERDSRLIEQRGGDCLFVPATEDVYPSDPQVSLTPGKLAAHLCGPRRPGHFEGVLTIVAKLFNLVEPDVAVFGRKDAQQARIITRMAHELNFPVQIVVAPTVREPDRVAMSSRNSYLSPDERAAAAMLPVSLDAAYHEFVAGTTDVTSLVATVRAVLRQETLIEIEYVEAVEPELLAPAQVADSETILALAVRIGRARLIDNILLGEGVDSDEIVAG